jgi:hypothetical protein
MDVPHRFPNTQVFGKRSEVRTCAAPSELKNDQDDLFSAYFGSEGAFLAPSLYNRFASLIVLPKR